MENQSNVTARYCMICGEEFSGPIGKGALGEATEKLAEHIKYHTYDQVVRVYVLGEPWYLVMRDYLVTGMTYSYEPNNQAKYR